MTNEIKIDPQYGFQLCDANDPARTDFWGCTAERWIHKDSMKTECPNCQNWRKPIRTSGWQPIETAPKDRHILLRWTSCKHPSVGCWSDDGIRIGWRCDGDRCVPRNQHNCTHWHELPPIPEPEPINEAEKAWYQAQKDGTAKEVFITAFNAALKSKESK